MATNCRSFRKLDETLALGVGWPADFAKNIELLRSNSLKRPANKAKNIPAIIVHGEFEDCWNIFEVMF